VVTICTASLTFSNSTFCPHTVFMCSVWISEQTAIISLYSINWLVFITETECYCAVRTVCIQYIRYPEECTGDRAVEIIRTFSLVWQYGQEFEVEHGNSGERAVLLFDGYVQFKPFRGSDGKLSAPSLPSLGFDPRPVDVVFMPFSPHCLVVSLLLLFHKCSILVYPPVTETMCYYERILRRKSRTLFPSIRAEPKV